ncbi:MAG TPA: hypothetical protein VHJ79_19225, partial [Mycobacterium sp.]|nr:hypothetical protein [Mycobacterium sp.]
MRTSWRVRQCDPSHVPALTTGLLMGGAGAGIAFADTGDAAGGAPEPAAVTSDVPENNSDSGATGASHPDPPTTTVGNGREDVGVQSTVDGKDDEKESPGATTKKVKGSVTIPFLPISIPLPTFCDFLAAMQPQPEPAPAPGPAFRTQEEAPPVADSGGGGIDPLSVGVAAEPPVLRAPMVIVPPPIPRAPAPRPHVASRVETAGARPTPVVTTDVAAGAAAPVIRGSMQPTVEPAATSLTPMSGQATRLGYPRPLRNPTTAELALLA